MKINQLRYFQTVCKNMSFTKAANELYVSQPAVSATIHELEDEFGIRLFHRQNNKLSLTEEGKWLSEKCEKLLKEIDGVEKQLQLFSSSHNYLRVGIAPMIGNYYFFTVLNDFIKKYPSANIEVIEAGSLKLHDAVMNNTADIGVAVLNGLTADKFDTFKLYDCELMFCVGREHPLAGRSDISFEELSGEKVILLKEDSYQNTFIKSKFKEAGSELNILLNSNQLSSVKKMLYQGSSGAFLFKKVAEDDTELVGIPFRDPIVLEIGLIWMKNQKLYTDMQRFINYVRQNG